MSAGYVVLLRRNLDGEVRRIEISGEWDDEGDDYLWSDGNFGCDCNRALLFAAAAREEDPDIPCGEGLYTAIKAILPDGREVPLDSGAEASESRQQGPISPK